MSPIVYRPDRRMIPPVIGAMVLGLALLLFEGLTQRGILLIVLLAPFYYIGAEILARRVEITSEGLEVRKLLRRVHVSWPDVESLDAVASGRKVFAIILTREARPILLTNTLGHFSELVQVLIERSPSGAVTEHAREILQSPPSKIGPLVQAWIVCIVLGAIVTGRVLGYGS